MNFSQVPREIKRYFDLADQMCRIMITDGKSPSEAISASLHFFGSNVSRSNYQDELKNYLEETFATAIEIPSSSPCSVDIVNHDIMNSTWWTEVKESLPDNSYWKRYEKYLLYTKNRTPDQIKKYTDDPTDHLMNILVNPRANGDDERKGLVFGHVQSGKTTHYIGLINKAVDAGYKVIIVLAGMHNILRSQTHLRIDTEVLGFDTSKEVKAYTPLGVGNIIQNNKMPTRIRPLTDRDDDGDIKDNATNAFNDTILYVVKKNKNSLEYLLQHLCKQEGFCTTGKDGEGYYDSTHPLLLIDDEADQASVNTKDCFDKHGNLIEDYKPSTLNGLIRKVLSYFHKKSYVGYTATPYANIFINPEAASRLQGESNDKRKMEIEEYGYDLFPEHFILSIPTSKDYIGAREFFGWCNDPFRDTDDVLRSRAMPLYVPINDINVTENDLFNSTAIKQAILSYLISVATRNIRRKKRGDSQLEPNSMLIHIDWKIDQQKLLETKIIGLWKDICNNVKYNHEIETELKNLWENDYLNTTEKMFESFSTYMQGISHDPIEWNEIYTEIRRLTHINTAAPEVGKNEADPVKILTINGDSGDILQYEKYKRENKEYNVIAIGGNKLSRGLTLEGLMVSYFERDARTYDTLMQMGRWFGYRPYYADLCRLYAPESIYQNFLDVSIATDDLVYQFETITKNKGQPKDVGLSIITNPNVLISNQSKIKTGETRRGSFSSRFSQTSVIDVDADIYDNNFNAVEMLLNNISQYRSEKHRDHKKYYYWDHVPGEYILEFFKNYQTSKNANDVRSENIYKYIYAQVDVAHELNNWTVCLKDVYTANEKDSLYKIADLEIHPGVGKNKANADVLPKEGTLELKALSGGDDYLLDQDSQYIKNNMKKWTSEYRQHKEDYDSVKSYIVKQCRTPNEALLILYPLNASKITGLKYGIKEPIKVPFGFAISFPEASGKVRLPDRLVNPVTIYNGGK